MKESEWDEKNNGGGVVGVHLPREPRKMEINYIYT